MTEKESTALRSVIDTLKEKRGVRILYIIQILGLIYIILNPIGLPITIDRYSLSMYDDINGLPDGSVVLFQAQSSIAFLPETQPGAVAVINKLFSMNIKIMFYSLAAEGPIYLPWILDEVRPSLLDERVYGVDWVMFGFAPGGESAVAAMGNDIRSVFKTDIYGTLIDEISMMKDISDADDITIVVSMSGSIPMDEASIRQWVSTHDMPYYIVESAASFAALQPYYPSQIRGMLNGVLGGTQMEILTGFTGKGAKTSDALTYVFFLGIATVIAGNIASIYEERRKTK